LGMMTPVTCLVFLELRSDPTLTFGLCSVFSLCYCLAHGFYRKKPGEDGVDAAPEYEGMMLKKGQVLGKEGVREA